jgi:hypothetical protein
VQQQLEAIIAKYPGIGTVLARDDEQAWDQGLRALMEGELYIGFFSDQELEEAATLLSPEKLGAPEMTDEEMGRASIQALRGYLAGLLTLERRAEMRDQLLTMLEDEDMAGEWGGFFTAMLYDLDNEDPDAALVVLTAAMLGEMGDLAEYMAAEEDGEAQP